jgi:hypothetical protein
LLFGRDGWVESLRGAVDGDGGRAEGPELFDDVGDRQSCLGPTVLETASAVNTIVRSDAVKLTIRFQQDGKPGKPKDACALARLRASRD